MEGGEGYKHGKGQGALVFPFIFSIRKFPYMNNYLLKKKKKKRWSKIWKGKGVVNPVRGPKTKPKKTKTYFWSSQKGLRAASKYTHRRKCSNFNSAVALTSQKL